MFFEVKEADYVEEYRIRLRFEDGSGGVADLSEYPDQSNVSRSFLDTNYFKNSATDRLRPTFPLGVPHRLEHQ